MKKRIISWQEFQQLINKVCTEMTNIGWKPDYIVGITRGGLTPAVMISHWFNVTCETLKVSLRDTNSCESNLWMPEDAAEGKKILVVDDINDSGATINWILNDWESSVKTNWQDIWNQNVKFACIFDNLSSNSNIKPDFVGEYIDKDKEPVWIEYPFEDWWTK